MSGSGTCMSAVKPRLTVLGAVTPVAAPPPVAVVAGDLDDELQAPTRRAALVSAAIAVARGFNGSPSRVVEGVEQVLLKGRNRALVGLGHRPHRKTGGPQARLNGFTSPDVLVDERGDGANHPLSVGVGLGADPQVDVHPVGRDGRRHV